ncbi:ABC transporter I family member 1 [Tanacetum coccineum]
MMVDPSYSQEQMGLAGFSKPSAGEILWNGHDINESGVCHQYKLQPKRFSLKEAIKRNCTVLDNVQWFEWMDLLDEPSVALDAEGVKLLEQMIADHRSQGGIVIVATHLPIQIEDAMFLRLPPRFPRRITLVDMLTH